MRTPRSRGCHIDGSALPTAELTNPWRVTYLGFGADRVRAARNGIVTSPIAVSAPCVWKTFRCTGKLSSMACEGSTLHAHVVSGRVFGILRIAPLSLPICVGLLLVISMSGCKDIVQPPASSRTDTADRVKATASPRYDGDVGPGRRRSRRGRADRQTAPGVFDFYLLNLSWSPEFCATHGESPECGRGLGFVVHGLWPQDANGNYPEACSNEPGPANPQAYTDIIPTASLVEHEWQMHGTCSGLTADAYFAEVRKAFASLKIPGDIGVGTSPAGITPEKLLTRFAKSNPGFPDGSIAVSCGNNRLTAIEVCLTKDLQPESCGGVRSCRANVIQVAPK